MLKILRQIVRVGIVSEPPPDSNDDPPSAGADPGVLAQVQVQALQAEILGILGRALAIRQVDAGSCNGCELEIHALNNPYTNIEGLGIRFVASPRHADMLLVTGPVTRNMAEALRRTFEAMPAPRLVVALGDCACDGGIFGEAGACCGRVSNLIPVDVVVPGCPPPPLQILRGILRAVRSPRPRAPDAAGQQG